MYLFKNAQELLYKTYKYSQITFWADFLSRIRNWYIQDIARNAPQVIVWSCCIALRQTSQTKLFLRSTKHLQCAMCSTRKKNPLNVHFKQSSKPTSFFSVFCLYSISLFIKASLTLTSWWCLFVRLGSKFLSLELAPDYIPRNENECRLWKLEKQLNKLKIRSPFF